MIRGSIERKIAGLPDIGREIKSLKNQTLPFTYTIVPLGPDEMEESLGPGYGVGYWGWENLIGRPDQCRVQREELQRQRSKVDQLRRRSHSSVEELCLDMTSSGRQQTA